MKISVWFLTLVFVYCSSSTIAGVSPIANMAEYNGTYYGTPGTGGICDSRNIKCDSTTGFQMFTTLYRDNYLRGIAGCAGERCGKHPGVDISVASNTPVRASLAGKVIEANCDWKQGSDKPLGFGGIVIIESLNPYVIGGKVYVSYAHLNNWSKVSVGQTVTEGQLIGYSGGDPAKGMCPGGSGGAHLHFQVDKFAPVLNSRSVRVPWYPVAGVEASDTDFAVTAKTHNPLPFVLGKAYNYTFNETGNKELWGVRNVDASSVSSGELRIDSSSTIPYMGRSSYFTESVCAYSDGFPCSREITLDADIFKKVVVQLNYACISNPVTIYFRGPDDIWHGGSFNYDYAREYRLGMSGLTYWKGIITDVLIQASQGCSVIGNEYRIGYMYFLR
jgi:hypothetical protein